MRQSLIIKSMLASRILKNSNLSRLVDDFIRRQGQIAGESMEPLLASLYLEIMDKADIYSKSEILSVVEQRLTQELRITPDLSALESIYEKTAMASLVEIAGNEPLVFAFDETDFDTLASVRNNFFWLQDHTGVIQDQLKDKISEAFTGDIARVDLGVELRETFGKVVNRETAYYKAVADHIISQSQNMARINQGEKYSVPYYRVVARMDDRTTKICRSLNGRYIRNTHMAQQVRKIEAANTIDDKKKAAGWKDEYHAGPLPSWLGLPPYHFRCRTIVQPVWDLPNVMDENMRGYEPGKNDIGLLKTSLSDIRKEGVLDLNPAIRVLQCGNGQVILIGPTGKVAKMQTGGFDNLVSKTIYEKTQKELLWKRIRGISHLKWS